jgi:MFS family permease
MTTKRGRLAAYWERQLDQMEEDAAKRARKLPAWRTRKRRRLLAGLTLSGALILITGAALFTLAPVWLFAVLWGVGFVTGAFGFIQLRIVTGKMSDSFSRLLDEREREWRHRTAFVAYQVLIYLMLIVLFYELAIKNQPDAAARGATMLAAVLATAGTVPSMILGWTLPDDDPEDFLEPGDEA